ncbi:MAG: hypothetical protein M3Y59_13630 [Myxococcota bacterium]|nr:hypothetical protein [Myxococcota bacterium]
MDATNGNGAAQPGIGQRVDQVGRDAQTLIDDARTAVNDIQGRLDLRGRVDRNPYGTLLAAAGVGYLLGGGLFSPLTARFLRLGVKLAALPFVKDELLAMAHGAVDGFVASAREREVQGRQAPAPATDPHPAV